jgi:hypothetical protein
MKKLVAGLAFASLFTIGMVGGAAAQSTGSSGNGGVSSSDANGGAVSMGNVESGNTTGSNTAAGAAQAALASGQNIAAAARAALGL